MKKGIKQVEELANALIKLLDRETVDKFIEDEHGNLKMIKTYSLYEIAKELYNAGYRKVDENEMIVKKWDYNGLLQNKETLHKVYKAWDRSLEEQHQNTKELLNICTDKVRKETAKEILNSIIADDFYTGGSYELTFKDLRELAEKYGVEVEQ